MLVEAKKIIGSRKMEATAVRHVMSGLHSRRDAIIAGVVDSFFFKVLSLLLLKLRTLHSAQCSLETSLPGEFCSSFTFSSRLLGRPYCYNNLDGISQVF